VTSEEYPDVRTNDESSPVSKGLFARFFGQAPAADGPRRLLITLVIFAVALGLRVVHMSQLEGTAWEDERGLISDSEYYDMRANEIASGELVGAYPGFLSPLYCYVLGAGYAITGSNLWAVKLLQIIFASLAIALVHRITRRMFSEAAAVIAALLLACHGPSIYYSALLLPTTLVFGLHATLIWVLVRGELTPLRTLKAGLLIGLCIGAKANALLLLPVLAIWFYNQRAQLVQANYLRLVGALALGAAITITPITWRNYATSGEFILVTTTGGRNMLKGNGETATGTHSSLNEETIHIGYYLDGTVDIERSIAEDRELKSLAWQAMGDEPIRALQLFGVKLQLLFNQIELGIRDDYRFARMQSPLLGLPLVSFALIASLGLVGLVLYLRDSRHSKLLGWILLAQVASFVLIFVLARYRMVLLLCLAPFAGQALAGFVDDLVTKRIPRAITACIFLVPSIWFVNQSIEGFEKPNPPGELHRFVGDWHFEREEWKRAFAGYNRASKSDWHISNLLDHWAVRARLADCYAEMDRPQKAALVREGLLTEVMEHYPFRQLDLKDELLMKLGLEPETPR
jgi:4-amino-4-deoxy-L-arabinose transferase-like glycosyltransferase